MGRGEVGVGVEEDAIAKTAVMEAAVSPRFIGIRPATNPVEILTESS